jgi:hypothetical protein
MNRLSQLVVCLAAGIQLGAAAEVTVPNRPPGVSEASWIPITDRLGIVLLKREITNPGPQALIAVPEGASGYYMVKIGPGWTRLTIAEPIKNQ